MYNPSACTVILRRGYTSGKVALLRDVPKVTDVIAKFGYATAQKWIELQLYSIEEMMGNQGFTAAAKRDAAGLIIAECRDLNIAEILLFFARYKVGEYDNIYSGGVHRIMIALRRFRAMRNDDLIRIMRDEEYRRAEEERTRRAEKCISYEEYLKQTQKQTE